MGVADPVRTEHAELLPRWKLPAAAITTEGSEDEVLAALDYRPSLLPARVADPARRRGGRGAIPQGEQVMQAPGTTTTT